MNESKGMGVKGEWSDGEWGLRGSGSEGEWG